MPLILKGLKKKSLTRIRISSFCSIILEFTCVNIIIVVTHSLTTQLQQNQHFSSETYHIKEANKTYQFLPTLRLVRQWGNKGKERELDVKEKSFPSDSWATQQHHLFF